MLRVAGPLGEVEGPESAINRRWKTPIADVPIDINNVKEKKCVELYVTQYSLWLHSRP